jgi:hypothetical protein
MNTLILAIDDGIAQNNFDAADIFFAIGAVLAVIAGLGYAAGVATVARHNDNTPANGTTIVSGVDGVTARSWHYTLHQWAAALAAFAIASIAFGLFLL